MNNMTKTCKQKHIKIIKTKQSRFWGSNVKRFCYSLRNFHRINYLIDIQSPSISPPKNIDKTTILSRIFKTIPGPLYFTTNIHHRRKNISNIHNPQSNFQNNSRALKFSLQIYKYSPRESNIISIILRFGFLKAILEPRNCHHEDNILKIFSIHTSSRGTFLGSILTSFFSFSYSSSRFELQSQIIITKLPKRIEEFFS